MSPLTAPSPSDYDKLLSLASELSGIPEPSFLSKDQGKRLSRWRMMIFYILREQGATFQEIGSYFNRHYSTVIHGCKVLDSISSDSHIREQLVKLLKYKTHGDTNIK